MTARVPDELHILNGTFRGDRHGNPAASVTAEGDAKKPAHLRGEALKFWKQYVPGLIASGLAKERDAAELAGLCEWWARYRKLSLVLDKLKADDKRYYQVTVNTGIAWDKFNSVASRFGLTPADRAKIRVSVKEDKGSAVPKRKRV